jgi:hypothetical protein
VFLWLVLAVESLRRAPINGDAPSDLEARLEQLPTGLYALYKDMWECLNDDIPLYRQRAAAYLNLVVTWLRMERVVPFLSRLSLAQVVYVQDSTLVARHTTLETRPSKEDVVDQISSNIRKHLPVQCAGLLEVSCDGDDGDDVSLVHRSAIEFLTEMREGKDILSHDPSTEQERVRNLVEVIVVVRFRYIMLHQGPSCHLLDLQVLMRRLSEQLTGQKTGPKMQYLVDILRIRLRKAYSKLWDEHNNRIVDGGVVSVEGGGGAMDAVGASAYLRDMGCFAATLLDNKSNRRPVSQDYLLYLLECICTPDYFRIPESSGLLQIIDLLLEHGLDIVTPCVSLETLNLHEDPDQDQDQQSFSRVRTAFSMIVELWWLHRESDRHTLPL